MQSKESDQPDPSFDPEGQPDPIQPDFGPQGPNSKSGLGSNWVYQVHYRVELKFEPFMRSTRPDWTHFWIPLKPKIGPKIMLNLKKRVGFG